MSDSTIVVVLDPENTNPTWGVASNAECIAIPNDKYDEATRNDLAEEYSSGGEPLAQILRERNAYRAAIVRLLGQIASLPVKAEDVGIDVSQASKLLSGTASTSMGIRKPAPASVIATADEIKDAGMEQ